MNNTTKVKLACYSSNISMAVVANLSPLLFLTFVSSYGLSYSLLGLLVLINFVTQLFIDLIFSFFSHKFNIPLTVKIIPVLTFVGLIVFALIPLLFPSVAFLGMIIGTVIFAMSGGLGEVLLSPIVAALPSDNPDHEMSKLHSVYAWGVVVVIILSTLFLLFFGENNWFYLPLCFSVIPLVTFALFVSSDIPALKTEKVTGGQSGAIKNKTLWLCVLAIFLGGAAECAMSQWSSSYLEQALGVPKAYGDIFGVALFAFFLGLGRTLYAKIGKNIERVMFLGSIGATVCYALAVVSPFPIIGLVACAITGFCVSMLWPGSLIAVENRLPSCGVFVYALMAAGGDLGASVSSQLVGLVADAVSLSPLGLNLSSALSLSPDQIGMRAGMLVALIFPLVAVFIFGLLNKQKKKALPLSPARNE